MTRWLFVRKPTIKNIMQRTESKSWSGKNVIVPRTPRFSNHVVKGGMKTTGNGSTNIGDLIMPRIRNRSSRDFVTKNKEK